MFYVLDDKLYTAPADLVLLGITRKHILSLAEDLGYKVIERKLHKDDLIKIGALFVSGTSTGVLPVSQIDNLKVPSMSNKIIIDLLEGYHKLIHKNL